jgi:hypothetical protein
MLCFFLDELNGRLSASISGALKVGGIHETGWLGTQSWANRSPGRDLAITGEKYRENPDLGLFFSPLGAESLIAISIYLRLRSVS